MYGHGAGVRADVGAGKSERFAAHLAEASHKAMVWDAYAYKLRTTRAHGKQQMIDSHY